MNPDVSVAPEIAQLMAPLGLLAPNPAAVTRLSVGDLARQLKLITAAPERWWHLVRFDPGQPVVADIPVDGPYRAWLTILPPAATGSASAVAMAATGSGPNPVSRARMTSTSASSSLHGSVKPLGAAMGGSNAASG